MILHRFKKHKKLSTLVSGILILGVGSVFMGNSAGEPASSEDPIVTQSYVDQKLEEKYKQQSTDIVQLNNQIKLLQDTLKKESLKNEQLQSVLEAVYKRVDTVQLHKFEIIELKNGQKLIGAASSEIILRSGKARAITSPAGGLPDITADAGTEIKSEGNIPVNHLILIPRDDGRGIRITSPNAWVMIKGKYEIK